VAYEVIPGDPRYPEIWDKLYEFLLREWPHANGGSLQLWASAIDTGFCPEEGYSFCRRFPQPQYTSTGTWVYTPRTVFPIKGGHSWQVAIEGASDTESARHRGGLRIITLGSPYLKLAVMGRLQMPYKPGDPYPPGFMHYPYYDRWVFDGLCSESVVTDDKGNRKFIKDGRNEPLDLAAYHIACLDLCRFDSLKDADWEVLLQRSRKVQQPNELTAAPSTSAPATMSSLTGEPRAPRAISPATSGGRPVRRSNWMGGMY
jgi:phage terminase large subunit GpA-like protein